VLPETEITELPAVSVRHTAMDSSRMELDVTTPRITRGADGLVKDMHCKVMELPLMVCDFP
jgi:CheY-specific phosphatase CheX